MRIKGAHCGQPWVAGSALSDLPQRRKGHTADFAQPLKLGMTQSRKQGLQLFRGWDVGHSRSLPDTARHVNRIWRTHRQRESYALEVSKNVLWANVQALMRKHYGQDNLSQLARDCDIGLGTTTRIKQQKTSVGLDIVERIAERFGVQPWQLLVPGFDPDSPPTLLPVSAQERQLYERLRAAVKEFKNVTP